MREILLARWAEKYRRIENEITRCEKHLETLKRAKKNLALDIRIGYISLIILSLLFLGLAGLAAYIPWVFLYFYVPVLALLATFVLGRSIIKLFKNIARFRHHKRQDLPFEYPKPPIVDSNYPTNIPPNYYAEQVCVEWLIEKYNLEMSQLKHMRKEIEQASEDDYKKLEKRLEEIKIYEIVGRAK